MNARIVVVATVAIVGVAVALLIVRPLFPGNPWTTSECDRVEKEFVISPDGSRVARHFFFGCYAGLMTQTWDTIVIVKADHAPGIGDEVWRGEVNSPDKVSLAWKSSNRLQITLPNESITYKKTPHTGVILEFPELNDHAAR